MTTWFVDPVSGNSAYGGDSYALKTSGTDGVSNGTTTFTSATANFTGLTGFHINVVGKARYTISSVTNANTVVLSGSPSSASGLTFYVGGAVDTINNTPSTGATPLAAGDSVNIAKTPDPLRIQDSSAANLNATFTNLSATVTLSAAATVNLTLCETAWTAGAGVTTTTSTTRKEGAKSTSIATDGTVTAAALLAYFAVTQDCSAYKKVCFWIRPNAAVASGVLTLKLCSDALGVTAVHTISIPALTANNWFPVTFDNAGALSAGVNSIALYCTASFATKTVLLDNIFIANRLTLTSVISKDSAASGWTDGSFGIQSINGTTVILDSAPNTDASTALRGYYGTTQTVAVYAREVQKMLVVQTFPLTGSAGNVITYSGGWNMTNGTQDGETFWDGSDGSFNLFSIGSAKTYLSLDRLHAVRAIAGFVMNAPNITFVSVSATNSINQGLVTSTNNTATFSVTGNCYFNNTGNSGISIGGSNYANSGWSITGNITANSNASAGISFASMSQMVFSGSINANNNASNGVVFTQQSVGGCSNCLFSGAITCNNNGSYGIWLANNSYNNIFTGLITANTNTNYGIAQTIPGTNTLYNVSTTGNTTSAVTASNGAQLFIVQGTFAEGTIATMSDNGEVGSFVAVQKFGGVSTDSRTYKYNGVIKTDTSTRHTASGVSWNLQPNANAISGSPLVHECADFAVDNTATTVTMYAQRDNTAVIANILIRGGFSIGVAADQVSGNLGGSVSTWAQLSVAATASETSEMRVRMAAHAAGATGKNAWFDDAGVT